MSEAYDICRAIFDLSPYSFGQITHHGLATMKPLAQRSWVSIPPVRNLLTGLRHLCSSVGGMFSEAIENLS